MSARHVLHLVRRWWRSLSNDAPSFADTEWAASQLLDGEWALWQRMGMSDRRHSIEIARRFVRERPGATRDEIAGALLHDVGKIESDLSTTMRVVATVVGPRGDRFRRYHHHEALGLALAEAAGSSAATLELLRWKGPAAAALLVADDI